MKLKTFIVTVAIGLCLSSCESNEPKFSCDDNVESWVKNHLGEVQSMTRSEWLKSDPRYSLAMYRAFTHEQRVEFWREKFNEVKQLSWTDSEIAHIAEAERFFENHLDLFNGEKLLDSQLDEVELFLYKWSEKAEEEFGWNKDVVYAIVASGNKVMDTNGNIDQMTVTRAGNILSSKTESASCNCHVSSLFTCSMYHSCDNAECSGLPSGCGGFLLWSCDGLCEEP